MKTMDEVASEGIEGLIEVAFSRVQKKAMLAAHYGDVLDILRDGVCDKCESPPSGSAFVIGRYLEMRKVYINR